MNRRKDDQCWHPPTASAVILCLCVLLCLSSAQAQQPRRGEQAQAPTASTGEKSVPSVYVSPNERNRITIGDTVELAIEDAPELSKSYAVSPMGTIEMPFLGAVAAQNLSPDELAKKIALGLKDGDYLKNPQVAVTIKNYQTESYFIQGAVRTAGVFLVRGQPSLLSLISMAGGLADNHGSTAFILRRVKAAAPRPDHQIANVQTAAEAQPKPPPATAPPVAEQDYELLKVNLASIFQGRFEQNLRIEPGDIVNIPRADVFFVAGEVNSPGSYPLKDGTTLRQAISLAQGTTFKAVQSGARIFRDDPATGKRQEIPVDVAAVMNGKKADIPILANDVIIIPNSRMKSIGSTLLMALGVNSARLPMR